MSTKKFSTTCATKRVTNRSNRFQKKPLAYAMALALVGCVAVPAGAWAATLQGQRFIDTTPFAITPLNSDPEPPYTARSYIVFKLLNNPQLTQLTAPVRGNYTIVLPDGDYEVWQFADPAVLTTFQLNTVQWANTGNSNQVLKITVAGSTITWTDTGSAVVNNKIDFPFPDFGQSLPIPPIVGQECDVTDSAYRKIICAGVTPPSGISCDYNNYSLTSPWPGNNHALFASNRVFVYGKVAVSSYFSSGTMATVTSLCNHGTLVSDGNQDVKIQFDSNLGVFANFEDGEIIGADAPADSNQPGASITLQSASLAVNLGTIQAGNASTHNIDNTEAGTFSQSWSLGGNVTITADNTYQYGELFAGQGSEIRFSDCYAAWVWEHNAGNAPGATIGLATPSNFAGNATISGGALTLGNSSSSSGGMGGSVVIDNTNFNDIYCMSVNEIEGGDGGNLELLTSTLLVNGSPVIVSQLGNLIALKGSSVYVEPDTIEISGNTTITADEDVVIFGGDNYVLRMTTLQENAITAGRNIILAVGSGGTIDLRGITSKAFKAGGKIEIYADNLVLDKGVTIENLVSSGVVVRGGNKIIYHAVFSGSQWVTGKVGETVPIQLTLHNGGPKSDTYTFAVTSKNGSTVNGLPATVTVEGLKRADLNLNVTLPTEGNDVITVTATSQADSTVVATTQVQAAVEKAEVVEPEKVTLTLTKSGEGSVTAQGIDCGEDCTEDYTLNTEVKLTATPANGYQFANWSGDCTTDTLTMDAAKSCSAQFTAVLYTTHGTLLDKAGKPLSGVTISTNDKTATTNDAGNWEINDLTIGDYTFSATKEGYTFSNAAITLEGENTTQSVDIMVLSEPQGSYTTAGTLKDKAGNPIANATVQVGDKTTMTDELGNWSIDGLFEGKYDIVATKDNFNCLNTDFELGNNDYHQVVDCELVTSLKMVVKPSSYAALAQSDTLTYTIDVVNGGEQTATGVTLANLLPEGTSLVALESAEAQCDNTTLTCTLPDLATGHTARVKLTLRADQANTVKTTATLISNEYPVDVKTSFKAVKPHLSVTLVDTPDPVVMQSGLHYQAVVELSALAPEDTATGINLTMQLPKGTELVDVNTEYGNCDSSAFPVITCQLNDLSVATPDSISRAVVDMNVKLLDEGLLILTHEAKVSATNYPAHTDRERTNIVIPPNAIADIVLVVDTTKSMDEELNGVIAAIEKFIQEQAGKGGIMPKVALVEFKDNVVLRAFTDNMDTLLKAVRSLTVEGGGLCPEASAEALNLAISHTKEGGVIVFSTDASPYPDADMAALTTQIKDKGIVLKALVSGDCGDGATHWNDTKTELNQ